MLEKLVIKKKTIFFKKKIFPYILIFNRMYAKINKKNVKSDFSFGKYYIQNIKNHFKKFNKFCFIL